MSEELYSKQMKFCPDCNYATDGDEWFHQCPAWNRKKYTEFISMSETYDDEVAIAYSEHYDEVDEWDKRVQDRDFQIDELKAQIKDQTEMRKLLKEIKNAIEDMEVEL